MANGQVGRLSVRVLPDTTQFRRDLKKALDRAEKQVKATIDAELRVTKASLANVKRQLQGLEATVPVMVELANGAKNRVQDQLDGMEATATVGVDVDHGIASAQVAAFTRPRILPVNISINKASLTAAASAIAALSGARVLGNFGRGIKNAITNLDRALPALAAGATAIASLGAAALAGTSNLFALGASLASIAPAALVLPGILAGFGVGLGVMIAALSDAGDVLDDLGPQFTKIQKLISKNFWRKAEGPIRNLADKWLPTLSQGFGHVATELGGFFASMTNALSSGTNVGFLQGILFNTADAIDIAAEGIANFVDGLMNLTNAGSAYLPQMASWFNRISENFSEWVQLNTDNGNLFEWIDAGVLALQDFGRVLGATGGILGGFATAAANAGGANLGALADGLENVNRAVNGPAFQGALTTVFQGAHDAMKALGPGVAALGDAFVRFAPTLAEILVLAGEIGSVGLEAIAVAFENPAFQGGLTDFFEGILTGVEALAPHIPALAAAFGSVASFAGTLAAVLGPVLGAAIEALAPVVTEVMEGLSALAPVLGEWLVTAIQAVAPFIQDLVSWISEWVQENPELAATIGLIVGAIGLLVAGAVSLIGALAPVIAAIVGVVGGLSGLGLSFTGIGTAIAGVLGPIGLIIGLLAAIAGALVYAWQTSEPFRQAVVDLFTAIWTAAQPVIAFITGTLIPVVSQVAGAFMGMVQTILDALIPFWTVMLQIWTEIINILTPVVTFILSVLAPVFTHLGNIVSAAFTFIGVVISEAINIITAIMQVFLAVLQGDWSGAWEAIKNVGAVIWSAIKNIIGAAIEFVVTVIQSWLATARSVWNSVWGGIRDFAVNIWNSIVSRITAFIRNLVNAVVAFVNDVKSNIQNGFNTAKRTAIDAFQQLVSGVKDKISNLIQRVRDLPGDIKSGLGNLGSLLYSAGKDVIQGLINGIKNMAGRAVSAAKGVVGDAVSGAKNLLGIASPSKVFMEIGEYTGEGMVIGLEHKARAVNEAMTGMVTPPSLPAVKSGLDGQSGDSGASGVDLSDSSIERLADAMLRRPLKIGTRQAGMLAAAGATTRQSMGGSW